MKTSKKGLPPGTVVYTGEQKIEKTIIDVYLYNESHIEAVKEVQLTDLDDLLKRQDCVTWLDIRGLHDIDLLHRIGKEGDIHPLILEDIADVRQRPKYEPLEKGAFLVLQALYFNKHEALKNEQISMFITPHYLISFQEKKEDVFEPVKLRLMEGRGIIRGKATDYLAYSLIDVIVDDYFEALDKLESRVFAIEQDILDNRTEDIKERLHSNRRILVRMSKAVIPWRDALLKTMKLEDLTFSEAVLPYMRDLYDHTVQVIDRQETLRDIMNGLRDLYHSELNLAMNKIMQVLTIISTIFIPLTFLVGVYGMNFEHMPELKWRFGYALVWMVMIGMAILLLYLFKKKKWF
ncbi:MAG: magnesium/cobalt transporter CorA [Saprospiraceae bacterium]